MSTGILARSALPRTIYPIPPTDDISPNASPQRFSQPELGVSSNDADSRAHNMAPKNATSTPNPSKKTTC